jgi:hypothetical protein
MIDKHLDDIHLYSPNLRQLSSNLSSNNSFTYYRINDKNLKNLAKLQKLSKLVVSSEQMTSGVKDFIKISHNI